MMIFNNNNNCSRGLLNWTHLSNIIFLLQVDIKPPKLKVL